MHSEVREKGLSEPIAMTPRVVAAHPQQGMSGVWKLFTPWCRDQQEASCGGAMAPSRELSPWAGAPNQGSGGPSCSSPSIPSAVSLQTWLYPTQEAVRTPQCLWSEQNVIVSLLTAVVYRSSEEGYVKSGERLVTQAPSGLPVFLQGIPGYRGSVGKAHVTFSSFFVWRPQLPKGSQMGC